MRSIINLMLVLAELSFTIAATVIGLALSSHFLGEKHVYFGLWPVFIVVRVIVDVKDRAMDKLDDTIFDAGEGEA